MFGGGASGAHNSQHSSHIASGVSEFDKGVDAERIRIADALGVSVGYIARLGVEGVGGDLDPLPLFSPLTDECEPSTERGEQEDYRSLQTIIDNWNTESSDDDSWRRLFAGKVQERIRDYVFSKGNDAYDIRDATVERLTNQIIGRVDLASRENDPSLFGAGLDSHELIHVTEWLMRCAVDASLDYSEAHRVLSEAEK